MVDAQTTEQKDETWSMDGSEFRWGELCDLIDCNRDELRPGQVVYVGDKIPVDVSGLFDADDIIESLAERAYDNHGECAEDWPEPSKEAKAELNDFLKGWINKHCEPTFYSVGEVREYTITAEDLQE